MTMARLTHFTKAITKFTEEPNFRTVELNRWIAMITSRRLMEHPKYLYCNHDGQLLSRDHLLLCKHLWKGCDSKYHSSMEVTDIGRSQAETRFTGFVTALNLTRDKYGNVSQHHEHDTAEKNLLIIIANVNEGLLSGNFSLGLDIPALRSLKARTIEDTIQMISEKAGKLSTITTEHLFKSNEQVKKELEVMKK